MPDGIELFGRLPKLEIIEAVGRAKSSADRGRMVALLRQEVIEAKAALCQYTEQLDELEARSETGRDVTGWFADLVRSILEWEHAEGVRLSAWISALKRILSSHGEIFGQDVHELSDQSLQFADGWLLLLKRILAAERRINRDPVLRGRPVEGEIDYAELSR